MIALSSLKNVQVRDDFFFSRCSEDLITFQNLLNRSTVPSSQTSQVAREQALRGTLAAGREKGGTACTDARL